MSVLQVCKGDHPIMEIVKFCIIRTVINERTLSSEGGKFIHFRESPFRSYSNTRDVKEPPRLSAFKILQILHLLSLSPLFLSTHQAFCEIKLACFVLGLKFPHLSCWLAQCQRIILERAAKPITTKQGNLIQ